MVDHYRNSYPKWLRVGFRSFLPAASAYRSLLRDCAAGDARAGVARRVGLHVVGRGMNDQRSSAVAENGVRTSTHRYIGSDRCFLRGPVGCYRKVLHIAGVRALRVLQPVLLLLRIEMPARRRESWNLALRVLMNMNGVLAGRQILQIQCDLHSIRAIRGKRSSSDTLALSILEIDCRGLGCEHNDKEAESAQKDDCFEHGGFFRIFRPRRIG